MSLSCWRIALHSISQVVATATSLSDAIDTLATSSVARQAAVAASAKGGAAENVLLSVTAEAADSSVPVLT